MHVFLLNHVRMKLEVKLCVPVPNQQMMILDLIHAPLAQRQIRVFQYCQQIDDDFCY